MNPDNPLNDPQHPLRVRFPEMTPISSPPTLSTVNGIGAMTYGRRDEDVESGTYVLTLFFTVIFVPLFGMSAYRVADAPEGGWYFLGKVPLSGRVRGWNWFLVLALVGGLGFFFWNRHYHSDEAVANRRLAQAEALAAAGKVGQAARTLDEVQRGPVGQERAARKMEAILAAPRADVDAEEASQMVVYARRFARLNGLADSVHSWAKALAERDAKAARALLRQVEHLPEASAPALLQQRRDLLEQITKRDPNDFEAVVELAEVYDANRDEEAAAKLLLPFAADVKSGAAARILGQHWARRGDFAKALPLLQAYLDEKLPMLHTAEKKLLQEIQSAEQGLVATLQTGKAADFDYARYKSLTKDEQMNMVDEYLRVRLLKSPAIKSAQEELQRHGRVVPVALDLGIVQLRRAQGLAGAERTQELEKAEKTFLAVRGAAGKSDAFRLYLGQVYYWMGKEAQGRKLFDELLGDRGRASQAMFEVATMLREVGADSEGRQLLDEGYAKENAVKEKQKLAGLRALMCLDLEEKDQWLKRCDPTNPAIIAASAETEGDLLLRRGQDEQAAEKYRRAIKVYDGLPVSSTVLNNNAIAHRSLYRATGDPKVLARNVELMEQAASLDTGNSIQLQNLAGTIEEQALTEIVGATLDLRVLKQAGSMESLAFLYRDAAGREKVRQTMLAHPGLAKARKHYERLLVMAPKNLRVHANLMSLYAWLRDQTGLEEQHNRLKETKLDLDDVRRLLEEDWSGKKDDKRRADLLTSRDKYVARVQRARETGGATLAVALADLVRIDIGLAALKHAVDVDAVVKLAEEAVQVHPCRGAGQQLESALLLRAHDRLTRDVPSYAAWAKNAHRIHGADILIALALNDDAPLRSEILKNADVRRALDLLAPRVEDPVEGVNVWLWAMLRHDRPEAAQRVVAHRAKDPLEPTLQAIERHLAIRHPAQVYRMYWAKLMIGEDAAAQTVLDEAAAQGVPLVKKK